MDNRNLWGRKAAVLGLHHPHLCPCTHAAVSSSCLSSMFPHEDLVLGFSVLVAQSWSTLCDPPWTVLHQAPLSMEFSRQVYWSRWLSPSLGDLPSPGIKPRSLALQVEFFPAELQGKPKNTGVGGLSLLQWIFLPQESNQGLLHCRWILYPLNCQGNSQRVRSQNQIRCKSSSQILSHLTTCGLQQPPPALKLRVAHASPLTLLSSYLTKLRCEWLYWFDVPFASLIAQFVKNPPAMQVTPVRFLGQEDPLEKG